MIKVNLLKNRGGTQVGTMSTQLSDVTSIPASDDFGGASNTQNTVVKILLIVIWVAGLMTYEHFNKQSLSQQAFELQRESTKLDQQIKQNQALAAKAKDGQKRIQELQKRIKIIKDLSKTRLREIKAIDYIQNSIPDKLWLTQISITDNKLILDGNSLSDDQLNKFLDSLESKSSFKNVILLKAIDQSSRKGTLKQFEISSELGGAE